MAEPEPEPREVWFPGEFTTYHLFRGRIPITYTNQRGDVSTAHCEPPFDKIFSFPITRVVHMTHSHEKDKIWDIDNQTAHFKPKFKCAHDTFKASEWMQDCYLFSQVDDRSPVLPGKYVWFGMKPSFPVDDDFEPHVDLSDVEWASERSRYGPWVFDLLYSDFINIYQHRITEYHPGERVSFRIGGTLRYRHEICYVVVVTHTGDELHSSFPIVRFRDKPILFSEDLTTPPCFYPWCVPVTKKGYLWSELADWDHVVFAVHCDWRGTFDIPGRSLIPLGEPYDLFDDVPFDEWKYIHGLCVKTLPKPSWVCLQAEKEYRRCRARRH